eukprot:TRINITY_DN3927_c0_g2_i1.p1 TRINITY_DN3927_c0_g2~~TRINITY_DN3927_c0_g2_i1.p1  ORF type:complete len:204 (+),score=9.09 TRINITY_DN3927_c0_g2_i1:173-784(+)
MNQKVRSSLSHPISVSWIFSEQDIIVENQNKKELINWGKIGVSYCPGKKFTKGDWKFDRDIKTDLKRLRQFYVFDVIVCLLGDYELRTLGVHNYANSVQNEDMEFIQFPIIEMRAPESMDQTMELLENIIQRLKNGQNILLHCKGGVGRAGTIAACLLLYLGVAKSVGNAIQIVRTRRCKNAVESYSQERFISRFSNYLNQRK